MAEGVYELSISPAAPSPTGGAGLAPGSSPQQPFFAQNPSTPASLGQSDTPSKPETAPKKAVTRTGGTPHESVQPANAKGRVVTGATATPKKGWSVSDWGHGILGVAELVPGVSDVAGAIDGTWYLAEGDYLGAAGAYATMIPFGKEAEVAGKLAKDGVEATEDAYKTSKESKVARDAEKAEEEATKGESVKKEPETDGKGDKKDPNKKGEPVVVTRGEYVEDWDDYRIDGTISLVVRRYYGHQMGSEGPLGRNRTSLFDTTFTVTPDNKLVYRDDEGRRVVFDRPFNFLPSFNAKYRHLELSAPWLKKLSLVDGRTTRNYAQGKDQIYRLVSIADAHGNMITFSRSPDGVLTEAEHSDGYVLVFSNDPEGRRLSATLQMGGATKQLATYVYDLAGNMVHADCTTAFSIRYAYDTKNRLAHWEDSSGRTATDLAYDEADRVTITRTSGAWNGDTFSYDAAAQRTIYRPGGGDGAERTDYDDEENVLAETDGLGNETRYSFENGYLTTTVDPLGHVTKRQFDRYGNLSDVIDPEGRRTLLRWQGPERLAVAIDGAGGVRRYEHDARGNVVLARDPLGHETRYDWTAAGRLAAVHRPDGHVEHRTYDAHHRLVAIEDARGGITRFLREDPFGRVTAVTDPLGHTTRYGYEDTKGKPLDLPTSTTRPDGVAIRRTYDGEGQVASITDGEGRTTRYSYGAFDQLVSVTNPKGGVLSLEYDVRGLVSRVTNANGRVYAYERDGAGRVVAEIDFDGRRLAYVRDATGRVIEQKNADGGAVTFAYDRSGLLLERCAYAPDATRDRPEERETFTYDEAGRMVRAENSAGLFTFARDKAGRVVAEGANGRMIESRYDALGRRVERRIGDSLAGYAYDPLGALTELLLDGNGATHRVCFERDALGREIGRGSGDFRLEQSWDAVGQLCHQSVAAVPGRRGAEGLHRRYDWNKAFEPTAIVDSMWGGTSYVYDANGQVVEARHGEGLPAPAPDAKAGLTGLPGDQVEVERFAYDAAKDIAASDTARPGDPLGRPLTPWLSSPGGKVKAARGANGERILLTHDVQGRVVERRIERNGFRPKVWLYKWNALDRMTGCVTPEGERWTYEYDPFSRRVSKRKDDGKGQVFLWDGDVMVQYLTHLARTPYFYGRSISWHYEPRTQRVVGRQEGDVFCNVVIDHIGVPREIFDVQGQSNWTRRTRLWGDMRDSDCDSDRDAADTPSLNKLDGTDQIVDFCPIRFQGQWSDIETSLYYNRFRIYDPRSTQYACPDPLGLSGGMRPMGYVHGPTAWTDPFGLSTYVTYAGNDVASGKPYVGFASSPVNNASAADVMNYRYSGDFSRFGGQAPDAVYVGDDRGLARGLEQRTYENLGGAEGTANAQNPIGERNPNRDNYLDKADDYLDDQSKQKGKGCG